MRIIFASKEFYFLLPLIDRAYNFDDEKTPKKISFQTKNALKKKWISPVSLWYKSLLFFIQ